MNVRMKNEVMSENECCKIISLFLFLSIKEITNISFINLTSLDLLHRIIEKSVSNNCLKFIRM